ncbi:MAG: signal peptide peptidase SppA [Thermodesulfovibrionia bacterium]|nr:signal peptide peptidase SppA [Thermodesulfovibrionia bacterium]
MKKVLIFFAIVFVVIVVLSLMLTVSHKIPLGEKVALVRVTGVIIDSTEVIEELKEYSKDASVKAIVLRVNSPGGGVAPSQEIYDEIVKIKEKKKVVASMGSVAASGGYYIASPADKIVANAGTLTGSIGVIMEIPNVSGLMEKIGVTTQVVKSGKHKDIASVFKTMTPEEKKILQTVLDDVHDQFIEDVSNARGMKPEDVRKLADGRIFTGRMAKEAGLVDELGNLQDAIMLAGELTGIEGEPEVIEKKDEFSFFDLLKGEFRGRLMGNAFSGIQLKYLFAP